MMVALQTDGDSPVINAYPHRAARAMVKRITPQYRLLGNRAIKISTISNTKPTCKPETARICMAPTDE